MKKIRLTTSPTPTPAPSPTRRRFAPASAPAAMPARRGFTAAELSIGMLVTALVAAAAAALMLAVSQGWTHAEQTAMAQVAQTRTCHTVEQLLRGARLIGRWRAGTFSDAAATPAGVLVWRRDDNDDGFVQFDEIAVLEYDGSHKRLILHKAVFPSEAVRAAANTTFADRTALSEPDAIEQFKGSAYTVHVPLTPAGQLTGACFNVVPANNKGSRPSFEFTFQFVAPGRTTIQYGTATLRSPVL